ncbi:MAG: glycosyltransferase [bacterium]
MKLLIISADIKIFEKGSAVRERMIDYGKIFEELHIIVLTLKKDICANERICNNVWVYSTSSLNKFFAVSRAKVIGRRIVREHNFKTNQDFIATQDPFLTGLVGANLRYMTGIPLQIQVHTDVFNKSFVSHSLKTMILSAMARYLLPKATTIRVVSERIRASIKATLPQIKCKIVVLPISVNKEEILKAPQGCNDSIPFFSKTVLAVGRLESEKNFDFLIKTWPSILEREPEAGLIIVGSGSQKDKLQSLINKLKLHDRVVLAGWQKDIYSYYEMANAFVSTSLFEGYGMALVEAGIHELPIITSNAGIVGEILRDKENALVYEQGNSVSLKECVLTILNDKVLSEKISLEAKRAIDAKLISWQQYLEEYKNSFKK